MIVLRPILVAGVVLLLAGADRAAAHVGADVLEHDATAAIAAHPDDPAPRLMLAKTHQAAQHWDAALAAYDDAAAHGADRDTCDAGRGQVLLAAGFPISAKRLFDEVLARRPDAWGTLYDRARAEMALHRPDAAAYDFARAIAGLATVEPEHVLAHRDALLAAGRPDEALRALDAGMARIGAVASLQLAAIDLEAGRAHWDAALRRLDQLLRQTPRSEAWIVRRAELLERLGRAADARREYERALALLTARPAARRSQAQVALTQRIHTALQHEEHP